jgi:hypothetical protein
MMIKVKTRIFSAIVLMLMLTGNVQPVKAMSAPLHAYGGQHLQTGSTLTLVAVADAHVEELHPTTNNGASDYLQVENANNRNTESYVRFTVSGVAGTVQSARLRVYVTTNSSSNGPAVYTATIHGRNSGSPGTIVQARAA